MDSATGLCVDVPDCQKTITFLVGPSFNRIKREFGSTNKLMTPLHQMLLQLWYGAQHRLAPVATQWRSFPFLSSDPVNRQLSAAAELLNNLGQFKEERRRERVPMLLVLEPVRYEVLSACPYSQHTDNSRKYSTKPPVPLFSLQDSAMVTAS